MRIDLNLAGEPFRNRSLFWLGATAAYLIAIVALVVVFARAGAVGADTVTLNEDKTRQEHTIKTLEGQIEEIKTEQGQDVFSPADRQALDDARTLISRKAFSWSRLFGDLEPQVPKDAKISAIELKQFEGNGPDRTVVMEITGIAKDFGQMATFIENLDRTGGRFAAEPVENGPIQETTDFQFTVRVRYRPGGMGAAPDGGRANG